MYHKELIRQAINMAPECKLNQVLSNLINNCSKVFESILHPECKEIIALVQEIRLKPNFPTIRARFQILGEQYRQIVLQTFRAAAPSIYDNLIKRTYFCDYLLQTGIFTNRILGQEHEALYQRILNTYLQMQNQRNLFGEPDIETEYTSRSQFSQDINCDLLSSLANREGKII